MSNLGHPPILADLGSAGEDGLPLDDSPGFRQQLELCRKWGFKFEAAGGRLRLCFDHDQLVPAWIQQETPATAWRCLNPVGFLNIGSTNTEALDQARRGVPAGTLIYAEEQTAGKGRKDRSWFSPAGSGLYLSLVVRPEQPRKTWPLLTHVASVALAETLQDLHGRKRIAIPLDVGLKWPNDVLLSGKKCAGILLEAAAGEGPHPAAVVGIGLNVRETGMPDPFAAAVTSVDRMAGTCVPRRRLLVDFLECFQRWYLVFERGRHGELLERWKSLSSMWSGAEVWISDGAGRRSGVTCGLDANGALLVRTPEGKVETLLAGDVTIRKAVEQEKRR